MFKLIQITRLCFTFSDCPGNWTPDRVCNVWGIEKRPHALDTVTANTEYWKID